MAMIVESQMKNGSKALKAGNKIWHYKNGAKIDGPHGSIKGYVSCIKGDVSHISGNVSGISGDVSDISGDVSWISGNLDDCGIADENII